MRCDELDSLKDAYLDSELETRTTIQIEEHLKSCPGCARLIAREERFQRQLHAALNKGEATPSLWLSIEEAVKTSAVSGSRLEELPPPRGQSPRTPHSVLVDVIRTRWRRAPVIWAGLSGAWLIIIGLNLDAREDDPGRLATTNLPSVSEMHLALRQKQVLLTELAAFPDSGVPGRGTTVIPGPRSEAGKQDIKT